MPRQPRCLLLDAMGTLLTFEPPAPRLRAALRAATGADVADEAARCAIRAEIAYYRAHLHLGADAAGLGALRRAAAEAMRPELPDPAAALPAEVLVDALLDALRFHAYPEVPSTRPRSAPRSRIPPSSPTRSPSPAPTPRRRGTRATRPRQTSGARAPPASCPCSWPATASRHRPASPWCPRSTAYSPWSSDQRSASLRLRAAPASRAAGRTPSGARAAAARAALATRRPARLAAVGAVRGDAGHARDRGPGRHDRHGHRATRRIPGRRRRPAARRDDH